MPMSRILFIVLAKFEHQHVAMNMDTDKFRDRGMDRSKERNRETDRNRDMDRDSDTNRA